MTGHLLATDGSCIGLDQPHAARLVTLGLEPWPDPVPLTDADVDALLGTHSATGMVCLLGAAVDHGLAVVSDCARDRVNHAWAARMAAVVALDALLVDVLDCLAQAGIDVRVLKGSAVAGLDEIDPAWRPYHDVDVLVPSDELLAAADALRVLDVRTAMAPVGRTWAARHAKGITLVAPTGAQVDLHRTLAAGPFGERLDTSRLFTDGRETRVGPRVAVALADRHRFLHACYHAALGGMATTRHLRDVLLLARTVTPGDVGDLRAEGWSPTVVADAVRWAGCGGSMPVAWCDWASGVALDRDDRVLLDAYGGGFADMARASFRHAGGPLVKSRYLASLVWPSRAHLVARGETRLGRVRRLVGAARTRRPG